MDPSTSSSLSLCCESTVPSRTTWQWEWDSVSCTVPVGLIATYPTFREADWAAVDQVLSRFAHSEAVLVRAELPCGSVSWRAGCEHSRPTFRWWDFNPHQAILPPPVTDPCLPISKQSQSRDLSITMQFKAQVRIIEFIIFNILFFSCKLKNTNVLNGLLVFKCLIFTKLS